MRGEQGGCTSCNTCPHMKSNTLAKLWRCLRDGSPEVTLDPALADRADETNCSADFSRPRGNAVMHHCPAVD